MDKEGLTNGFFSSQFSESSSSGGDDGVTTFLWVLTILCDVSRSMDNYSHIYKKNNSQIIFFNNIFTGSLLIFNTRGQYLI